MLVDGLNLFRYELFDSPNQHCRMGTISTSILQMEKTRSDGDLQHLAPSHTGGNLQARMWTQAVCPRPRTPAPAPLLRKTLENIKL